MSYRRAALAKIEDLFKELQTGPDGLSDEEARQLFLKWVGIFTKRRKAKQQTVKEEILPTKTNATYEEPHQETTSYKERLVSILRSLSARGFEELCLSAPEGKRF